mmetsp:Transcript_10023/g.30824  ORF Transcript_10023/g.30824 Transcript_10023/m.30824 type:complete len:208 (+) Transcript_10023:499-1122(+)
MMTTIADVDGDATIWSVKDRMSGITFHVVGALVKVTHTRDVVLAVLTDVASIRTHHHGRVPDGVGVLLVSLQDRRDDHHAVSVCQLRDEFEGAATVGRLSKLQPVFLTRAEGEWHRPRLLKTDDIGACQGCTTNQCTYAVLHGLVLLIEGRCGRCRSTMLNGTHTHQARSTSLLCGCWREGHHLQFKVLAGCQLLCLFQRGGSSFFR